MIKFFKYEMNAQRITVYPKYSFKGIGVILMIVMLILSAIILLPLLMLPNAHLSLSSIFFSLVLFLMAFLPFFVMGNRRIVFDATDKTIYQIGLLGKKKLMTFDEASPVTKVTATFNSIRSGYYYKITHKTNVYGKGYPLSPAIGGKGKPLLGRKQALKDEKEYEEVVIPAIEKMLAEYVSDAPQPEITQPNDNGILQYYRDDYNSRFVLKPALLTIIVSSAVLIGVLIILGNLLIRMQSTEGNYILPLVILAVITYASLIGLGKRIVFFASAT